MHRNRNIDKGSNHFELLRLVHSSFHTPLPFSGYVSSFPSQFVPVDYSLVQHPPSTYRGLFHPMYFIVVCIMNKYLCNNGDNIQVVPPLPMYLSAN